MCGSGSEAGWGFVLQRSRTDASLGVKDLKCRSRPKHREFFRVFCACFMVPLAAAAWIHESRVDQT